MSCSSMCASEPTIKVRPASQSVTYCSLVQTGSAKCSSSGLDGDLIDIHAVVLLLRVLKGYIY